MASDALKIVTQDDVEQAKRPAGRAGFLPAGEPVDPSKLMEVLGDIESLKREIQDRMRRIEAVKQAKTLLMEDALRTEALNKRLAEIGKIMTAAQSGLLASELEGREPEVLRLPSKEATEHRPSALRLGNEGVALAWPRLEEVAKPESAAPEAVEDEMAAATPELAEVREAAPVWMEADALTVSEAQGELSAAEETGIEHTTEDTSVAVAEVLEMPNPIAEVLFEIHAEARAAAADAEQREETGLCAVVEPAAEQAEEPVEVATVSLSRAEELVAEARRLLDESTTRLNLAVNREEQVTAELAAAQEAMASANAAASERLAEWERQWSKVEDLTAEAKRMLDRSTERLDLAASKEERYSTDFQTAQQALTAAYQSASQRLEAAEQYCKNGDQFVQETRQLLDKMKAELAAARNGSISAAEDLQSARQELTTAYQFASVAAQRRLDAAEHYRKSTRWMVIVTALAWVVAVWMGWLALQKGVPVGIPSALSCGIVGAAIFVSKRSEHAAEEV